MKRKMAMYWPVALIVPLAVLAWVHAWQDVAVQAPPLAGEQVGAELARAMSLGLVGGDDVRAVRGDASASASARAI